MTKMVKKYIEQGLREAAKKNGNAGRSITQEAIGRATTKAGDIVDLFLLMIEKELPPKGGRGTRMLPYHVELAYGKLYESMIKHMQGENGNEQ